MKRKRENNQNIQELNNELPLSLPSLEYIESSEPTKKRRKSSRIKASQQRPKYVDEDIEEIVEYQFEFENAFEFNDCLKSNIFDRYTYDINDLKQIQKLFDIFFIGMHIDYQDEHEEWYEAIIQKIRISENTQTHNNINTNNNLNIKNESLFSNIFNKYNIKLFIHIKHFSCCWDTWILLPSKQISVLRSYSNAYDGNDNVKPLPEIIRELDELQIVSIDFIAETLQLDRNNFIQWLNNNSLNTINENDINKLLKWTKHFIVSQKIKKLKICLEYFVKPGCINIKHNNILYEAILPNTLNIKLDWLTKTQLSLIQDVVINNLKNKKYNYDKMCTQCGIPIGLFQTLVFGITILLPQFIIDRIYNWSKGIHLTDDNLVIKEERLFAIKIQ